MLRVRFRTYCYGCRRPWGLGVCMWSRHRWTWEYWIHCDGLRLVQRQGFATFDRAYLSAAKSYAKLAAAACVKAGSEIP